MAAAPTLDEIKTAAQYAFTQGNYDDARTLDDLYKSQYTAQQPTAQPQQPVDPMAAYQAKVAADKADTKDSALDYSVDQAQKVLGKGVQVGGRLFGSDAMTQYGSQVVEQQDKDIAAGGYQPTYNKSLRETYNEDGLGSAIGWAAEKTAENAASGGAALIGSAAAAVTAPFSMPLAALIGGVTTVGAVTMGAGESAFEQEEKTGDYDAKLAAGVGALIGFLDKFGAKNVIPKDRLMKMTAEQISEELAQKGFTSAAASVLKKTGIEAATETAQEGLSIGSAAIKGGEYTPQELGDRALEAAVLGGTTSVAAQGGIGTIGVATNLVRGSGNSGSPADQQAAASFAQRLAEIAEANGYDLSDIDKMSSQGARETVDKAHIQYTEQLKQLFNDMKSRVAVTDQDTLYEVSQKILAASAYREGRNKTKSTVGAQEMAALESLAGDTREGQDALMVLRQLNQLTQLHNDGYQGGVSKITDQFAPLGGGIGYDKGAVATERLLRPLISGSAAISTGGTSLLAQAAAQGTGRMIDKVTGRRSVVDRFVRKNRGQPGIPGPTGPSLRMENIAAQEAAAREAQEAQAQQEDQAAQQAQAAGDLNEYVNSQGALPNDKSPVGTMSQVLGLDPEQLMGLLDQVIETEPNTTIVDAAISAQNSIVRGGEVSNLNALISMLKKRINPDNMFWINRERGVAQQGAQVQLSRQEENYQRGIENNRKAAAALSDELNADDSIPKVEKALLLKALQDLQLDLGLNPVATLESMYKRLQEQKVSPEAIDKYLAPYIERVGQQQVSKQEVLTAQDEVQQLNEPMDSRGLGAPVLTSVPKLDIISISNGTEVPPKLQGKTQVAGYLQERALEKLGGKVRQLDNEQDRDAIADDMVAEAIYEMESTGGNMEWYDSIMEQMVEMMSMKHPELKTDPDARTALFASIAITSQNLAVPDNLVYGEEVYAHYKKTGRFLEKKYGGKGASVKKNLEKANKLLDSLGSMQKLTLFLETKFTVGELEPILKKHLKSDPKAKIISGENVDQEVYGSAVFGPKIGNGFYTNLRGDFTPVTIDMWFMRTVGRLSGKVLLFDEKTFKKQLSRLKTAVGRKKISREQLIAKATEIKKQHEKDYKLYKAEYQSGERTKSEAVLAAESVVKSLKDTRDAPSSGTERVQLRDTVTRAVAKFKEQTGIDIPPASFQALIWYPEQDLYKKLGVKLKHTRADYANSTKALLLKEGYDEQEINAASDRVRVSREQGPGSVRPGTGVVDQRSAGQPGGRSSGTVQQQATPGILNQVDSAQLDLPFGKPDVIPNMARPTPATVKASMPKAQEAFEVAIGKPGSKFEKGVSTEADILQIAEILNIFPKIFDNRGDYLAASGKPSSDTSLGNFLDFGDSLGETRVLAAGVKNPADGKPITNLDFLINLVHENIGHALESRDHRNAKATSYSMANMHPQSSGYQHANSGSLRALITQTLGVALDRGGSGKQEIESAQKIRAEIEAIQDQVEVSFENSPELGTAFLRDSPLKWEKELIAKMERQGEFRKTIERQVKINRKMYQDHFDSSTDYRKYKRNNAEFSVDPVILYVMNPTLMKKVAPETAKLIQGHFNSSKIPVSFHANPIVTVLAIIMAGVAQMEDDEEEKKNPGALTPQPGVLTA